MNIGSLWFDFLYLPIVNIPNLSELNDISNSCCFPNVVDERNRTKNMAMIALKTLLHATLNTIAEDFSIDTKKLREAQLIIEILCAAGTLADLPSLVFKLSQLLGGFIVRALFKSALMSATGLWAYPIRIALKALGVL